MRFIVLIILATFSIFVYAQEKDTVTMEPFQVHPRYLKPSAAYTKSTPDTTLQDAYSNERISTVLQIGTHAFIRDYGPGSIATMSFRGTGASHTKFYWNGIELSSPSLDQSDLSMLTLNGNDVEVLYSGAGIFAGNGALGGAVSISQLPDTNHKLALQGRAQIGTFGEENIGFDANMHGGKWTARTHVLYHQSDNHFPYTNYSLNNKPRETQRHAGFDYRDVSQDVWYTSDKLFASFRYWATRQFRDIPKLTTQTNPSVAYQEDDQSRIFGTVGWKNKGFLISLTSAVLQDELVYSDTNASIYSNNQTDSWRNNLIVQQEWDKWLLRSQIKYDHIQADIDGYAQPISQDRISGAVNLTWSPTPKILVDGIARVMTVDDKFQPVSGALAAKWYIRPTLDLFANVASHFRYPGMNELYWAVGGNPDLKAENGYMTEAGLVYRPTFMTEFEMTINGYYGQIDNWIQWAPNGQIWEAQNLRLVETKGAECRITKLWHFGKWKLTTSVQYTMLASTNLRATSTNDQSVNKQLIYVPKYKYNSYLMLYKGDYRFKFANQYLSKRYTTTDNSEYLPWYQLTDVEVEKIFHLKEHALSVFLRVHNFWNIGYQAVAYRPMPGRTFRLGVRWNYEK